MNKKKTNRGKKDDKPVSFHPLKFEEAVKGILKVSPPDKKNDSENRKQS